MKLTYAIGVCNEHVEIESLLYFLIHVKDTSDDINVLFDTRNGTQQVRDVLQRFKDDITLSERPFDNDFSVHRNYHITKCSGDYIFMIDADEMPQEQLIKTIKQYIRESGSELLYIPRMNICPGYTQSWLQKLNFNTNQVGFINWPDYQGRIFKNSEQIRWGNKLHEKIEGAQNAIILPAEPSNGIWHIKTVQRQNKQGAFYDNM
jgi:hypothetical protein